MISKKSDYLMYTAITRTLCSLTVINRTKRYLEFGNYINS